MMWKWAILTDDGAKFMSGSSFNSIRYALDSAMDSALKKTRTVIAIEVVPTTLK